MNRQKDNTAFLETVYNELSAVLEKHIPVIVNNPNDVGPFREDLFSLVTDKVKKSFINGIQVGMKRNGKQSQQPNQQNS